jgi:radical SAM protein with 4Fe4S-binding SPASM domain
MGPGEKLLGRILRGMGNTIPPRKKARLRKVLFHDPAIRRYGYTPECRRLFDAVFFEVRTQCNSRCSFCAASIQNERRNKEEMSLDLYKKVLADLRDLHFSGRVAYHVTNEPLLFQGLETFVQHAREMLPASHIQIMTNGLLLTPRRGESLLRAGVDEIFFTFYRRSRGEGLPRNIREFQDSVLRRDFPLKKGDEYRKGDRSRRVAFKVQYRFLDDLLWSRGGTCPNKKPEGADIQGFCRFPWSQFNITTDGRVSKCCADVFFDDPMGNVCDQSVAQVWWGEKFSRVRRRLWEGDRRELPNCSRCDFFGLTNDEIPNPLLLALKYHFLARY